MRSSGLTGLRDRRGADRRVDVAPREESPLLHAPGLRGRSDAGDAAREGASADALSLTATDEALQPQEPLHELEVEICDTAALLRLASAAKSAPAANPQEWSDYDDFILVFLNNVRMLIRCVLRARQRSWSAR
jgi:hypothetical protein